MIHKKSQPGVVDAEAVEIDDRGEQVAAKPERDNSRNRTVGIVADEAVSLEQELFSPEIADIVIPTR